jgi:hypothetical protein
VRKEEKQNMFLFKIIKKIIIFRYFDKETKSDNVAKYVE